MGRSLHPRYATPIRFSPNLKKDFDHIELPEDIKENDLFYTSAGELVKATKIGRKYIYGIRLYQRDEIKCKKDSIDLSRVKRLYV